MRKVAIFTDSTADLSNELLKKYDINSLPLYVRFNEEVYRDGIDITTKELYKKVEEKKVLPKTAAVSPGDFIEAFKPFIENDMDILYISISSKLSATLQSANIASVEYPNRVFIVDSKNLSSGVGLLVLKATNLRKEGLSASNIKDSIEKLVPKVRSQFAIQILDYLHMGGRISGLSNLFGSILKVRPIIKVVDGAMLVYKKPMGKMSRALEIMLNEFFAELGNNNVDLEYIMITHSIADKEAKYMIEKVLEKCLPMNLIENNAGCVISSHCGEGTIGILYIVKQ